MVNYGNSKIYKIEPRAEHEPNEIYIGSTTKQYLSQRMDTHRNNYKSYKEGKSNFTTSFKLFDKYGLGNCDILLLENVNATNKDELRTREAYYIRNLECVNKITYDLNNAEEVKLVEDYFWYKYFVKSFKFDWGEYLKDYYKITYQEKLNKHEIVKQHFNKYELKIAIDIHKRIYDKRMRKHINFNYLISDIITFNSTKKLKYKLIEKLNNNK
jgi:hypothetical protein